MASNLARSSAADLEIQIEDLHRSFGEHRVLEGISLDIERGAMVAVVGGSGCGKTVLLNHVLGQLMPDRGRVRVADHDAEPVTLVDVAALEGAELDRIHAHWGVVFQRNALFSGSVLDNIGLGLREVRGLGEAEIVETARRVLAAVGLPDEDDFLAEDHNQLSGGMAKRLAVARALAMNPEVLFYDEPTTGLDPTSAAQMHGLILDTHQDVSGERGPRTTVLITHDKDLLSRLEPRVVMLQDGHVHFDGPFDEFHRSKSPVIRPYFDLMPLLNRQAH